MTDSKFVKAVKGKKPLRLIVEKNHMIVLIPYSLYHQNTIGVEFSLEIIKIWYNLVSLLYLYRYKVWSVPV